MGLGGLALLLLILAGTAIASIRLLSTNRVLGSVSLGLLVLVAVSGFTGPMLDAYPFNLLFWTTVAFVVHLRSAGNTAGVGAVSRSSPQVDRPSSDVNPAVNRHEARRPRLRVESWRAVTRRLTREG